MEGSDDFHIDRVRADLAAFLELMQERPEFPGVALGKSANELVVIGDLHGDLVALKSLLAEFPPGEARKHVFLGDYVDRSPEDCPTGGFDTFMTLVRLKLEFPDDFYLLRGNHESYVLMEFAPHDLPNDLWKRYPDNALELDQVLLDCFEALPLFALTETGLYLSHGGVPTGIRSKDELLDESSWNRHAMLQAMWGDPAPAETYRGPVSDRTRFDREDLETFLNNIGASVMVRGHDYHTLGQTLFGKRLLTIFTTRRYARKAHGGVLAASVSLDARVESTDDLELKQLKDGKWTGYAAEEFGGSN